MPNPQVELPKHWLQTRPPLPHASLEVPVWQVPSLSQQPEQVEGPQESVGTWGHPSNTTTVNTRNKARMRGEHSIAGPRTNYLDTNAKPEGLPSGERKHAAIGL
jgi:hypothetical protein